MKSSTKNLLLALSSLISVTILIALLFTLYNFNINLIPKQKYKKQSFDNLEFDNAVNKCRDLNLYETGKCLNNYVKTFYYYNITNLAKELTLEQLINEGGVCWHYSDLYADLGKELGFQVEQPIVDISNETTTTKHIFTIISNDEGYVILDQLKLVFIGIES